MTATEIVDKMLSNDAFSRWLGIELVHIEPGNCKLKMVTRVEMLNGFGILHGGISYSLADSALAFAANSFGNHALSVETSISHHAKVKENEVLYAQATPIVTKEKFSHYQVLIKNAEDEVIASFRGAVYNSSRFWA
jgi:acyl-CoA thioesterase